MSRTQSDHVQTQLLEITEAGYTPTKLVYKQYGDLKVFRCGDEMRLFGVVLEDLTYLSEFDHLVILLSVSEHEYERAGVEKRRARQLQTRYAAIDSEADFYEELDGEVFGSREVREFL
ncbi:hypothetical protein [Halorussus amylolyticus]|uniref:hypothetical protein n=1 Tax=Halorussus amylolyticus TaxID=1126242 RepID=UPI00104D6CF0|nr:hypothetical protein [Halorussus amylolyticus]